MSLSDIHQQLMDEPADQLTLGIDTCDELGNDLEPRVDIDSADAFDQGFVDFGPVAVVEPQRQ